MVLFRANILTKASHLLNLDSIYLESFYALMNLIYNYSNISASKIIHKKSTAKYFSIPSVIQNIKNFSFLINTFFIYIYRKLFNNLKWNVAFRKIGSKEIYIIKNPKNHFFDPFIIYYQKKYICYVEDFDFKKNKGQISAVEIYENGDYKNLGICIEENFHLSFPYIFKFNNNLYMCPETKEANSINIYKCTKFPLEWKHYAVAIDKISAVDPMIFFYNNYWWLIFTSGYDNMTDHNSRLFAYYSSNPISGSWKPLKSNPFYNDSRRARNGGIILENNKIYRINQNHETGFYGASFSINEILQLDKNNLMEIPIANKENKEIPFRFSHHFNSNNLFEVFDFIY